MYLLQNEPDTEKPATDDFEEFRLTVSDIVRDITMLLSGPHCFAIMFNMLQEEMRGDITWDRVEAILWIIAAIAPNVGNECQGLPEMLDGMVYFITLTGSVFLWLTMKFQKIVVGLCPIS